MQIPTIKSNPKFERIYVLVDKTDSISESGLYIPPESQDMIASATVLKIGPKASLMDPTLNVGDKVIFNKFAGIDFTLEGIPIKMMMVGDLFGDL